MDEVSNIDNHFSIKISRFFMWLVGMWPVEKLHEQFKSDVRLLLTIGSLIVALLVEGHDLFCSRNDLHAISYNAPTTITVIIEIFKVTIFGINRREVLGFNAYTEKTFWKKSYNEIEMKILNKCNVQIMKIVVIHFLIVQSVTGLYFCIPIVESHGKNSSERSVPFPLHTDIPYTRSPYYEIIFIFESACAMSVGICTTGFGGFLCAMNLYTAGQFKILQYKLEITCAIGVLESSYDQLRPNRKSSSDDWLRLSLISDAISKNHTDFIKDVDTKQKSTHTQVASYDIKSMGADEPIGEKGAPFILLRECIKQHQLLIHYMERVENLFSGIMLAQTLGAILELCFSGFQILLGVGASTLRTALSIQFLLGSTVLLLFFSWSSHEIIIQSEEIAEAAYRASWYGLKFTDEGRAFRQSLLIIIARARRPCILTVGKFAPMSLNTFTSVFNTSLSYFTILRQVNEELDE